MGAWESPIIRVSTGLLNTVNDTVIANQAGITGVSKFGGQLGKILWVNSEQIAQMFSSTVGTLYAGAYQYIQLNASSTVPAVGQGVFWVGTPSSFNVTIASNAGLTDTPRLGGVWIGGPSAVSRYGFIQIAGLATVLYKSGLTVTAATGAPVIVGATGLFDTNAGTNVPNFAGTAESIPVSAGLGTIDLSPLLLRG